VRAERRGKLFVTHDVVAFTCALLEAFAVEKHDAAAPVLDQAPDLHCMRQQRHRRPPDAQHLRQKFLDQRQLIVAGTIGALQQPAAQARLGAVHCVAGADLLRLRQKHFGVTQDQVANGRTAVGNVLEAPGPYGREPAADLRGRPRERPPSAQAPVQADRAFTSDRGFYNATIRAEDQQRDEAGLRKVDVGDRLARLKEDCSLLQRDLSKIPG
jgi:hypothetical protein